MIPEAKVLYERYKYVGRLPERAVRILNEEGVMTPRLQKPFTVPSLRPYLQERFDYAKVDTAIIKAAREYERELAENLAEAKAAALQE